jgi:hypothetical protein
MAIIFLTGQQQACRYDGDEKKGENIFHFFCF